VRAPSKPNLAGRHATRAFTLMELMVVVILVGILTVMAMPTMAEARYSARTLDDATRIAELYRAARTRALGRGAAMLVQGGSANAFGSFNGTPTAASGGLGAFFLYEAQVAGTGIAGPTLPLPGGSPLSSCGAPTTVWANIIANATSSLIDQVTLNTNGEVDAQIWTTLSDGSGTVPNSTSLCFTPLGRTYYQATSTPVFTPGAGLLHGELQIAVQRSGLGGPVTGLTRTVIVPDSGSTRIVSR
jgi:prepilin-type N-terminal cleavage/methylation domain-containing protein